MNGSPINRPRIRAEIRQLERRLSATSTSAEREPLLDQLEAKQSELHAYYRRLRELPRFDAAGQPLPNFGIHAPLEPDNNLHRALARASERSRRYATAAATGEDRRAVDGSHSDPRRPPPASSDDERKTP